MHQAPPAWLWNGKKERKSESRLFVTACRQLPPFDKHRLRIRFKPPPYKHTVSPQTTVAFKINKTMTKKKKKNYTWEPQHQFFCQLPECQYFLGRHFHASFIPQLYSVPFYFCSPGRWWHCRWHVNYCKPIIHLTLHPHFSLSFFFFYLLTHK